MVLCICKVVRSASLLQGFITIQFLLLEFNFAGRRSHWCCDACVRLHWFGRSAAHLSALGVLSELTIIGALAVASTMKGPETSIILGNVSVSTSSIICVNNWF